MPTNYQNVLSFIGDNPIVTVILLYLSGVLLVKIMKTIIVLFRPSAAKYIYCECPKRCAAEGEANADEV